MESQLITVPEKKTDSLDWVRPLKSFFTNNYGSYREFSESIDQFNKLRLDAKSCNRDQTGRDILYRYYGQLELFDLRVPVNDHGGVHAQFVWYDAFKDSKSVKQTSIAFEKLCVLFNLAAVLSEIASQALEEKDYKLSYQSLQNAAGIYRFISENFLNAPSDDLQQDTIKGLEQLMLSQAQEVFLMKILNGDGEVKHSLVAKLAKAAAGLYQNAHDILEKVPANLDSKWIAYCKLKAKLFNSLLYYHQANALKETKTGEAITYLRQAQIEIEDYKTNYNYTKYSSIEANCKKIIELVKLELPVLEKDNDYIFHDSIPSFETLTLKGLESVKSISINDQGIDKVVGKDIFEKIIPYSVHEQSSKYTELLASLLRSEDEKITISNEELASMLEYLNLPLKLNEVKLLINASNDSDEGLKDISVGDYNSDELVHNLNNVKKSCNDKLNQIGTLIDTNNLPYDNNVMDIRENISKTRQSLIAANETDIKISNLIKPYEKELSILKSGQVQSYLQNDKSLLDVDIDDSDIKSQVLILDKILSDLSNLKYEKNKTYKSLKDAVHSDDISKILILNKNQANYDEIFDSELLKFKPYQDRINLLISKQQELISSLKKNLKLLLTNKNYLSLSEEKSSYDTNLNRLRKAVESYQKFKNGHNQALKFYGDLLNFINSLEFKAMNLINTSKMSLMNLNYQQTPPQMPLRSNSNTSSFGGYQYPQSRQNSAAFNQYQAAPPPLPPQDRQNGQFSSSIYDQPSNYDPSMYSKFS